MCVEENGKPHKSQRINSEHSRTYDDLNSPNLTTHGNKKIKQCVLTKMAIREHGQPYAFSGNTFKN